MNIWAIILAAGSSSRLSQAGLHSPKQFLHYKNRPLFWHSALTFSAVPAVQGLIFVFPPLIPMVSGTTSFNDYYGEVIRNLDSQDNIGLKWQLALGGATRQGSVYSGLSSVPEDCNFVLIHDSARPFATATLIARIIEELNNGYKAVVPGLPVTDTIKEICGDSTVKSTPRRASLFAIQTPQGFELKKLKEAHKSAKSEQFIGTDDASLVERIGGKVLLISGEAKNQKITRVEDLELLQDAKQEAPIPYTCIGYDVHAYGGDRPFILGGVPIACDIKLKAHSDGDVLLHALTDAILASMGADAGDIGSLFPDTNPKFDNYSSGAMMAEALHRAKKAGITIHHIDMTIVAEVPKIQPHKANIAHNVAKLAHLKPEQVSLKASTEEKMGFTGKKKGIKATVCLTVSRNSD